MNINACMNLFGSVIRKAIEDYKAGDSRKLRGQRLLDYGSARFYLFSSKGLEMQIKSRGLDDLINIEAIRYEAKQKEEL